MNMAVSTSRLASLLGSASFLTIANALSAHAQQAAPTQTAQVLPEEIPENVLITGSLIRGTVAVGVPVINLSPRDFAQTGALTTADLFRNVPAANLNTGQGTDAARMERGQKVNLRGLDSGQATRSLLMIDNVRFPSGGTSGQCALDPSIIPALAQDRVDVLVDGASATYGSDAVAGVINVILKRGYDGATTQLRYSGGRDGPAAYAASQLWGRTWDGGDITLTYEWYDELPIKGSLRKDKWRNDYTPWGFDNRIPLASSIPGTISTGAPVQPASLGLGTSAIRGTGCTNCFAIPIGTGRDFNPINNGVGPTAPFSASTLNWASFNNSANSGTNGTRNEFDPFLISTFLAENARNGAVMTFDQRLTKDISLFGTGFYSNRRSSGYINPASYGTALTNDLSVAVPTWNPYYPIGAPTGLRVNYNISIESPPITNAYEVAGRYQIGANIALPAEWAGVMYYSQTRDEFRSAFTRQVNTNGVSAALGWTLAALPPQGTAPGFGTWTKPANVPYLNLFCDPRAFMCNSQKTLDYFNTVRDASERTFFNEKAVNFDGPLFTLPGGDVKAAVGAQLISMHSSQGRMENTASPNLLAPSTTYDIQRNIWAVFAQLNAPIIGEANSLPGISQFDLEFSWRHDQYSDLGAGTSNPKVAFNWLVNGDAGITIRGAWGNSFRAPAFGEISPLGQAVIAPQNNLGGVATSTVISIQCDAQPGSGAYKLLHPTVGPAFNGGACGDNTALARPMGISQTGSATPAILAGWRNYVNTDQRVLHPETATNWSVGVDLAPTAFLRGLDIQATWYRIKLSNQLTAAGNPGVTFFNQAARGYSWIVPTDLFAIDPLCNDNNTPTTCAEFQQMVSGILAQPTNAVPVDARTSVFFLNDAGIVNKGYTRLDGIDWQASYDWDMGDLGAWNTGITGTYYLHRISDFDPSHPDPIDAFHQNQASLGRVPQLGVTPTSRMRYRARLGWSNGPWDATFFVNSISHYFHTQGAPPNVNLQCVAPGGTVGGGTYPCLINNYSNLQPSQYIFDLSLGYDTGDTPANDYLRHVGIQLVIQNLLDRDPAFQYRIATGGGNPAAFDISKSYIGRVSSIIVTKTW